MIIEVLVVLLILLAGLAVFIASRPANFRIVRSETISVPAAAIFAELNDLHRWEAWSPWAQLDPASTSEFAGPASGIGSSMHWRGNSKVGEGIMTIIESQPVQLVRLRLEFLKPFKATNTAEFSLEPHPGGTVVTWSMTGTNNFGAKAFNLVVNCDRMVGGMFEQGLVNLKAVVIAAPDQR